MCVCVYVCVCVCVFQCVMFMCMRVLVLPIPTLPIIVFISLAGIFATDYFFISCSYMLLCISAVYAFPASEITDIYSLDFSGLTTPVISAFLELLPVICLTSNLYARVVSTLLMSHLIIHPSISDNECVVYLCVCVVHCSPSHFETTQ